MLTIFLQPVSRKRCKCEQSDGNGAVQTVEIGVLCVMIEMVRVKAEEKEDRGGSKEYVNGFREGKL